MSANANKFWAIFARKDKKSTAGISLKSGSEEIESEDQVKLIGMFIDNKLSYDKHISTCLKQAWGKINSIKLLGNFISKGKKILCHSYVLIYFKYFSLVWHFGNISNITSTKLKNFMKEWLDSYTQTMTLTILPYKRI